MKVLIACEFSGTIRDAFIRRGHDAMSCDLLPTMKKGPHYKGDVLDILGDGWDLMIAHPPCTHLCVSGARWFGRKKVEQREALKFIRQLMEAPIPRIAIENPVSIIGTVIRKPEQIIQPYQFGHEASKPTCLWLWNLPLLKSTKIVGKGERDVFKSGKSLPSWYNMQPGKNRSYLRSVTFTGIAEAMADQWGKLG